MALAGSRCSGRPATASAHTARPCALPPLRVFGAPARSADRSASVSVWQAPRYARGAPRSLVLRRASAQDDAAGDVEDDADAPPELTRDWREFRASLVAQSEVESALEGEDAAEEGELQTRLEVEKRARVQAASAENLELLKSQLPKLTENLPWAHALPGPEKGCLLIANESLFVGTQAYFNEAVIFIVQHDEAGSMGIILNRPTQYTMSQVTEKAGPFGDNPVYFGGDVGDGAVSIVHGNADVKDSLEIRPGLYLGGMESAAQLVNDGQGDAQEFKFFARYAGWGPGQLQSEVERGVWYCAAAARELVLKPVIQLPKPLWREVLELMGGEYAECSRRAYGSQERLD